MRYHLGCGDVALNGYVNVDIRDTPATDLVLDLNEPRLPADQAAQCVFSHAFFEHLRRDSRVPHLRAVRESLAPQGFVCYMGLPDFKRVAELYVQRGPGVVGPVFDLHNVYRYTHGDPEQSPEEGWEPQLHKSLFDVEEVGRLLRDAGYPSYVVFRYVFPHDRAEIDLSLGFYATAEQRSEAELQAACQRYLADFDGRFLQADTLRFEDGRSRPALVARAAGLPQKRLLQRIAYAAADRLAKNTHPA